jgi:hypothetical protein
MSRFFVSNTSFDIRCGGAHHSLTITRDGTIRIDDHDTDLLFAFTAFGAKRPECLVYYDWLTNLYVRVITHTYSSSERRPFAPYVPGTRGYEGMMQQPYAQELGHPPVEPPLLHATIFSDDATINERRFASAYRAISDALVRAAEAAMLLCIPALNQYKMPAQYWSQPVEFQGQFRFKRGSAAVRGVGKGSDPQMMRGDNARFILLKTSFSEYAEVLDKLKDGDGPPGTFALGNGDRAAVAAIVEWAHRGYIEVVAGKPMRGFTVKSRNAIIGWDMSRDDWVLKRWL